jgi:hypothetical protein
MIDSDEPVCRPAVISKLSQVGTGCEAERVIYQLFVVKEHGLGKN